MLDDYLRYAKTIFAETEEFDEAPTHPVLTEDFERLRWFPLPEDVT